MSLIGESGLEGSDAEDVSGLNLRVCLNQDYKRNWSILRSLGQNIYPFQDSCVRVRSFILIIFFGGAYALCFATTLFDLSAFSLTKSFV